MRQQHQQLSLLVAFCLMHSAWLYADDLLETGVRGFDRGEYHAASQSWLLLAETGHAEAQLFMGVLYRYGLGVDQSSGDSAYWYERAAENGEIDAQNEIGFIYELGLGVEQNVDKAASWYEQVRAQDICLTDTHATGRLIIDESMKP